MTLHPRRFAWLLVLGAAMVAPLLAGGRPTVPSSPPAAEGQPRPDGAAASETFTVALTGDSIITRRLSVYKEPEFLKMIELIRNADAAFTNLEMLFHDYECYPMNQSGGTYMRAEPELAKELVWAGFDLVSRANNHAGDYGALGMQLTTKYVREAGLVEAGTGNSLPEAREAKFLETAKGRLAMISASSTFPDHSRASRSRGDMPARPGLNPLRFSRSTAMTPHTFEGLRTALHEMLVTGASEAGHGFADFGDRLTFLGEEFEVGLQPGPRTSPNKEDLEEIAAVVRNARKLADYVMVTVHSHESGRSRSEPAEFLVTFARVMIDAGADMFVGHGPHVLRGIEIYKGKPILYSLGDFIFQNETLLRLPQENYQQYNLGLNAHVGDFNDRRYSNDTRGFPADREIWESVVAVPGFRDGELVELKLYPITLGFGKSVPVRGRPMLADAELSQKIINDLIARSKSYGTQIVFRDGIGEVVLEQPGQ